MHILKPFNQSVMVVPFENLKKFYLSVTALSFFTFEGGDDLLPEFEMWQFVTERIAENPILDMGMPKPRGEVLVFGDCYAPPGTQVQGRTVRLSIGPVEKELYVFGDRWWTEGGNGKHTDPLPFERMEMSWANAFGGPGFKRNPKGKGIEPAPTPTGETLRFLPNIEAPDRLVTAPGDRPEPAGFRAYEILWPQRMDRAGSYGQRYMEEAFPGLPADADWTFYNASPEDQWIEDFWEGDEPFEVTGMHPQKETVRGRLPGMRSRAFFHLRGPDGEEEFRELDLRVDTVYLWPDAERGIVAHRGVMPLLTEDADEVTHALFGFRRITDAPRPVEHFQHVLTRVLDEDDLISPWEIEELVTPPDLTPPLRKILSDPDIKKAYIGEGIFARNMNAGAEEELAKVRQELVDAGYDPDEYAPSSLPDWYDQEIPDPKEALARIEAEVEKVKQQAAEAEEQMKEIRALHAETLEGAAERQAQIDTSDAPQNMQEIHDYLAAQGIDPPVEDGEMVARIDAMLARCRELAKEASTSSAHMLEAPPRLSKERSRELMRMLREGRREGKSFANENLEGADLTGLDAPGIDLRNARLTNAVLNGAILSGANLDGTGLAYAELEGADLSKASGVKINLGKAKASGARFTGATLSNATLSETDLEKAILVEADLTDARTDKVRLAGARLDRADLSNATFYEIDLTDTSFVETNLYGTLIVHCTARNADFTRCKGEALRFIRTDARGALFRDAFLLNAFAGEGSDFSETDFSGAAMEQGFFGMMPMRDARFEKAKLNGSLLLKADMAGCNLRGCEAQEAIFRTSNLEGADLTGVDLRRGSLHGTRLVNASLRGSNLYMADLMKATFGNTNLDDAILHKTILKRWQPQ